MTVKYDKTIIIVTFTASELDLGIGGSSGTPRLQRAMSCDSVASDSSIMDIEPDMPRIGQLEFALEYDRCVTIVIRE